ncbi:reverse transcriptase domain-containing protein [Tanacetum coccineum]
MFMKKVRGESVMKWKTKVTTKEGTVIKFPRKFCGIKLATEEEVKENEELKEVWEKMEYKHGLSYASKPNPRTEPRAESRPCYNRNGGNGNGGNNGYSYKTFTSCNPKEFDGKGGAVALTRWIANMESVFDNCGCTANQRVKYAASCFVNKVLTWWNTQVQARGHEEAIGMSWNDFRALLIEEFCPSNEMEKLENEFWNLTMVGANHVAYTDKFHELAKLVPHMVTPESWRIKRYINGLAPQIRGMLRATQPTTIQSAILKLSETLRIHMSKRSTTKLFNGWHPRQSPCDVKRIQQGGEMKESIHSDGVQPGEEIQYKKSTYQQSAGVIVALFPWNEKCGAHIPSVLDSLDTFIIVCPQMGIKSSGALTMEPDGSILGRGSSETHPPQYRAEPKHRGRVHFKMGNGANRCAHQIPMSSM